MRISVSGYSSAQSPSQREEGGVGQEELEDGSQASCCTSGTKVTLQHKVIYSPLLAVSAVFSLILLPQPADHKVKRLCQVVLFWAGCAFVPVFVAAEEESRRLCPEPIRSTWRYKTRLKPDHSPWRYIVPDVRVAKEQLIWRVGYLLVSGIYVVLRV